MNIVAAVSRSSGGLSAAASRRLRPVLLLRTVRNALWQMDTRQGLGGHCASIHHPQLRSRVRRICEDGAVSDEPPPTPPPPPSHSRRGAVAAFMEEQQHPEGCSTAVAYTTGGSSGGGSTTPLSA